MTTDHQIRMILEWEIHRLGSVEGMAHHWHLLPTQVRAVLAGRRCLRGGGGCWGCPDGAAVASRRVRLRPPPPLPLRRRADDRLARTRGGRG